MCDTYAAKSQMTCFFPCFSCKLEAWCKLCRSFQSTHRSLLTVSVRVKGNRGVYRAVTMFWCWHHNSIRLLWWHEKKDGDKRRIDIIIKAFDIFHHPCFFQFFTSKTWFLPQPHFFFFVLTSFFLAVSHPSFISDLTQDVDEYDLGYSGRAHPLLFPRFLFKWEKCK